MRRIKKGFTILDCLISLMVISALSLLSINSFKEADLGVYYLMNNMLDLKSKALLEKEDSTVLNTYSNKPIYFNEKGNVNAAQTIYVNDRKIIVHLGNGYFTYE